MFDSTRWTKTEPFAFTSGPKSARVVIVGDVWGEQEDLAKAPFIGSSGQELNRMLRETGIDRSQCLLTNVFPFRPDNGIESVCVNKAEAGPQYPMPPLRQGKYILPRLIPEVGRLGEELDAVRPNLVIAMGNVACWALLMRTNISAIRGSISECALVSGLKVLPTYHPATIQRNWALRPIMLADLLKCEREAKFSEIRRPERWITVDSTLVDIAEWASRPATMYAVDIETKRRQITMIGFARSPRDAIVIPFIDERKPGNHYWQDPADEVRAMELVRGLLQTPIPKVYQNGLYDMGYLWRVFGMTTKNALHDTMLYHHSLYPELQKGLGFLGSIYTGEQSWKILRHRKGDEVMKKDE